MIYLHNQCNDAHLTAAAEMPAVWAAIGVDFLAFLKPSVPQDVLTMYWPSLSVTWMWVLTQASTHRQARTHTHTHNLLSPHNSLMIIPFTYLQYVCRLTYYMWLWYVRSATPQTSSHPISMTCLGPVMEDSDCGVRYNNYSYWLEMAIMVIGNMLRWCVNVTWTLLNF